MLSLLYVSIFAVLDLLYFWAFYNILVLAVGLRHLLREGKKRTIVPVFERACTQLPTISIIVPVKDEERVVGRLLKSLLELNYPMSKREFIIVEDGSTDKTSEICGKYAELYPDQIRLVHQTVSNGKPSALNFALGHVKGEVICVLDADNVVERDMLLEAAKYFEDGSITAVQGKCCSINAKESMLAKFISYEEAVRYETYLRGKDVLSLFVPLTGSCYFVRRSVLIEVGGWGVECLSEDLDLAARLTEKNHAVKYASDVRSWQENPSTLKQMFRQRTRWFRGSMEVSLKYGRLLRNLNMRSVDAEMTLSGPFMFLPCMLGFITGVFSLVFPFSHNQGLNFMAQGLAILNTLTLFLIGIALVYLAKPVKVTNLRWLPFVYVYWLAQNFVAFYAFAQMVCRRPRKWTKTTKSGVTTIE